MDHKDRGCQVPETRTPCVPRASLLLYTQVCVRVPDTHIFSRPFSFCISLSPSLFLPLALPHTLALSRERSLARALSRVSSLSRARALSLSLSFSSLPPVSICCNFEHECSRSQVYTITHLLPHPPLTPALSHTHTQKKQVHTYFYWLTCMKVFCAMQ